jgi:hypothetical protein
MGTEPGKVAASLRGIAANPNIDDPTRLQWAEDTLRCYGWHPLADNYLLVGGDIPVQQRITKIINAMVQLAQGEASS